MKNIFAKSDEKDVTLQQIFKCKNMVITVNRETSNQDVDNMLLNLKPRKLFRSNMFLGKIKWGEDGLEYQKRIRNEWD